MSHNRAKTKIQYPIRAKARRAAKVFIFKMSFPNGDGTRSAWYFTLKFANAELAIRWVNEKRSFLNKHFSNKGFIVFRFLDLNERPRPGSKVQNLENENPPGLRIIKILALPSSIE